MPNHLSTSTTASTPSTPSPTAANPELRDLGTHMAGAVDLHETRITEEVQTISPPVQPNPGPLDVRSGKYLNKFNTEVSNEP